MKLAEKIVVLRRKNNWSQEELAEQLGISRQSVSKWESGASVPDLYKILRLSTIFGVTTDYLLKEEPDPEVQQTETVAAPLRCDASPEKSLRCVTLEEVREYTATVVSVAARIGLGVVLCILGPSFLIGSMALAEPSGGGNTRILSENVAGGLGLILLFVLCAAGVVLLVSNGMKTGKYEYFEKEELRLDDGIAELIEEKKAEFEPAYRKYTTIGVALCILSVIPLVTAGVLEAPDRICLWCTSLLLVLIAVAVFLFIWSGMIHGSYDKVLQTGEYTMENKRINRKTGWFAGMYWCIVVAAYLGISFWQNSWKTSWIVWPVAGVLFAALNQFVRHRAEQDEMG